MNDPTKQVVVSAMLLGAALGALGSAAEPAGAKALKLDRPPALDGRLDEPFWADAEAYGDFFLKSGDGSRTDATRFRLAFDDTWLYVGLHCANDELHRFLPKHANPDDPVVKDDSVELFLDPAGDGATYFHYMLGYNNVRAEQIVQRGVKQRVWNVPWLSATSRDKDGWSAELAIPLFVLMSHGDLERMTCNLARNRRRIEAVDGQGEILSERLESSAWRPTVRNFHEPDRFAPLAGVRPERPAIPLLASLEDAGVRAYEVGEGALAYGVEVTVLNASGRTGEVEVTVRDAPADGAASETRERVALAGPAPVRRVIRVPAASMADRTITVVLRAPASGHEMGRRVVANPDALRLMTVYADRNYYTDEPQALIVASIGLPPERLPGLRVAARVSGLAGAEADAAAETRIPLPVGAWPVGTHTVRVELCRADGRAVFQQPLLLVKRAPKPGREWKIDHANRVILRNGEPFFGLSMCMVMRGHDPDHITRRMAEYGFTIYKMWINWDDPNRGFSGFTTPDVAAHASLAAAHGLFFLARPEAAFGGRKGEYGGAFAEPYFNLLSPAVVEQEKRLMPTRSMLRLKGVLYGKARGLNDAQKTALASGHYQYHRDSMLESVAAVKDAGNLFGYVQFDEPCPWQFPALLDFYGQINDLDGYHPQLTLFSGAPPKGTETQAFYDVLGQDPYWQPGGQGYRGWPRYVAAATASLYRRAAARRAPVWVTMAAEIFRGCRPMTVAEQECQTWLAVINGATYLNYFHCSNVAHADTWRMFQRINGILRELAPALTAPPVSQSVAYRSGRRAASGAVDYQPGEFDPEKWKYPDVQAVLKRFPDGRAVLLAANCFDRPTRCEVTVPGLAGTVSNRLSGAVLAVRDGTFAEDFAGYGIAAYFLDLPPGAAPASVTVSTVVAEADVKASETPFSLPHYVRPGKKNVLPNPSFEDATRPGYPDYFFMYEALDPDQAIGSGAAPVWGQCTQEAFHGRASLLISCPSAAINTPVHGPAGVRFYCQPQHDTPTAYTFSFYAKTDTPGLRLFYYSEYGEQTFELTSDWTRYHMLWTVPPRSEADLFRFEIARKQAGRVWLDALQVEPGMEVTDFEE